MRTRVLRLGPIGRELWRVKDLSLADLYYWRESTRRYGRLSQGARRVMHDAAKTITGMDVGPNEYWLAQTMSEAIEAAEALGI